MVRLFYGEAWKIFNRVHPQLSVELSNVHLGLCTDKFNLFGLFVTPYSCWSVILIIYSLPPRMCIKPKFMFLSKVIPGPNSIARN